MEKKDSTNQIKLISQALSAAVSSINLAKELLSEVSGAKGRVVTPMNGSPSSAADSNSSTFQLPGVVGTFDGQSMITEDGQKFQVPENYASKSMIVFGDKLKMIDVNGEKRFKQIERTKRQRAAGMVVKKEGRYHVVTGDGSYRVSAAAVSFFGAKEGDEVHIILPLNNKHVPFAALEGVNQKKDSETQAVQPAVNSPSLKEKSPERPSINHKEVEKKEFESVKKVTKVSKDKEKPAAVKPAVKPAETKTPTVVEKEVEKSDKPLIGDDELR